jgi:hypothetical protein
MENIIKVFILIWKLGVIYLLIDPLIIHLKGDDITNLDLYGVMIAMIVLSLIIKKDD